MSEIDLKLLIAAAADRPLSRDEAEQAFGIIMDGDATPRAVGYGVVRAQREWTLVAAKVLRAAPSLGWARLTSPLRALWRCQHPTPLPLATVAERPPMGEGGRGPCWSHGPTAPLGRWIECANGLFAKRLTKW